KIDREHELSKQTVVKGAAYIYVETIVAMVSGYIFWLIISRITTSQVIGSSSAVVSLGTIFSIAAGLGIPSGIQRFLGKSFSDHNQEEIKILAKASLLMTSIGIVVCTILILIIYNWIYKELR